MSAYRLYLINRQNHFMGVEVIEAADDEAARRGAEALLAGRAICGFELWEGARPIMSRPAPPLHHPRPRPTRS